MKKLSLAYFGTPDFSAKFLERLVTDPEMPVEVALVVTQPDKVAGRKRVLTESPVKEIAKKHNLPIATLLHGSIVGENNATIEQFNNVDLAAIYAFGQIIPAELLGLPKYGFWNVHPSLLPKYRGASPMATPLMHGATETGVTLIKMDEEIDHGPIIAQESVPIAAKDRRPDLEKKLTDVGYELFRKLIKLKVENGKLKMKDQNHTVATYTNRLTKKDGYIPLEHLKNPTLNSQLSIFNLFRGLYPWPGIWSKIRIKNQELRIKITDMDLVDGKLVIKKVQLESKREVDFETFKKAYGW